MNAAGRTLLKFALAALEKNDVETAREFLTATLALPAEAPAVASSTVRAVSIRQGADALGYSTKHTRTLIARGKIPTIGTGRATRVLLDEAIKKLRDEKISDPERAGADYAARRKKLRIVGGDS